MSQREDRILTTHTGSLPRPKTLPKPADPAAVRAAVEEVVRHQLQVGIDIVNDGEASKPSYATYVVQRLDGFGELVPMRRRTRGMDDFPEFWAQRLSRSALTSTPACEGPVSYRDRSGVEADIANLKAAAGEAPTFMTAASPGVIELWMPNRYYSSTEEYVFALADAMKEEYDAIHAAGIMLQLDCPDIPAVWNLDPDCTLEEFRRAVAMRLDALNHATRDIPPGGVRIHLCWGNYEGPHHHDVPLGAFLDLVLAARPSGVSIEGANPRHAHEWQLFEETKLPDGKVIIPGVLDSTTNFIEHPELVAQRILSYADLVGSKNVIAGTDCGFATVADSELVDPRVAWAKLAAMSEGAQLASQRVKR